MWHSCTLGSENCNSVTTLPHEPYAPCLYPCPAYSIRIYTPMQLPPQLGAIYERIEPFLPALGAIIATITILGTSIGVLFGDSDTSSDVRASSSHVTATTTVPLRQGDQVLVGKTYCTVGYVDAAAGRAYTAGHCLENTKESPVAVTANVNGTRVRVGTATPVAGYDLAARDRAVDGAVIDLTRPVALENTVTHDAPVLGADTLALGDTVCFTPQKRATPSCGPIIDVVGATFTIDSPDADFGDSGSVGWVRGANGDMRGAAGLLSYMSPDDGGRTTATFVSLDRVLQGAAAATAETVTP